MPLVTTRRTGLVDQVIEQLRASVAGGEWPVDTRIPTEPELAEALGVGRNTVREAVRALAHSGILEVRQGDGTYVRATSEVSGAVRRLCGPQLRDVLQVRRCLEVEGARLAAAARTEEDLAELRALLHRRDSHQQQGLRRRLRPGRHRFPSRGGPLLAQSGVDRAVLRAHRGGHGQCGHDERETGGGGPDPAPGLGGGDRRRRCRGGRA